jgi:hypothetical protein
MRPDRVHEGVRDRLDGTGLPDVPPALPQPLDGLQGVVDRRGDQLLADAPLEHADDPADPLVDLAAAVAGRDELTPDRLELERAQRGDQLEFVDPAERPQRVPDVGRLVRL